MYARKEKWPREKFGSFAIGPLLDRNSTSVIDSPSKGTLSAEGHLASWQQAGIGSFASRGTFDDVDGH
jgi:hypothetical protein